ncbi:hypothetical protein ABIA15_006519 [Sinorhizobium fredii]|uniref:hypothetical protein n=1 Tax=Rhizobium fredii TaxID=380 RepID=UPI00359A08A4
MNERGAIVLEQVELRDRSAGRFARRVEGEARSCDCQLEAVVQLKTDLRGRFAYKRGGREIDQVTELRIEADDSGIAGV